MFPVATPITDSGMQVFSSDKYQQDSLCHLVEVLFDIIDFHPYELNLQTIISQRFER